MRDARVLALFCLLMGVGLGAMACNLLIEHGAMVASGTVQITALMLVMIGAFFASRTLRRIRLSQAK